MNRAGLPLRRLPEAAGPPREKLPPHPLPPPLKPPPLPPPRPPPPPPRWAFAWSARRRTPESTQSPSQGNSGPVPGRSNIELHIRLLLLCATVLLILAIVLAFGYHVDRGLAVKRPG